MLVARELLEHLHRLAPVERLLEDPAVERDRRVGGEHRRERQVPLQHAPPARLGFRTRHALDIQVGQLAGHRDLVDVRALAGPRAEQEQVKAHADLRQQLAPPRAA